METVSENCAFGGLQGVYRHHSDVCGYDMTFAVYVPPGAGPHPVLWYLSGLTCTHENAMTKAGMQQFAAEHSVAVVFPDTSPRGEGMADDDDFDLGKGAGFYVDATEESWAQHFRMWTYVTDELPRTFWANLPPDQERQAITGHSMGGHGALTVAMRLPERFASVLIDQGTSDRFLELLKPEALAEAMAARRQPGAFRLQTGYDHSYFFMASFMEEHVAFHAEALWR